MQYVFFVYTIKETFEIFMTTKEYKMSTIFMAASNNFYGIRTRKGMNYRKPFVNKLKPEAIFIGKQIPTERHKNHT